MSRVVQGCTCAPPLFLKNFSMQIQRLADHPERPLFDQREIRQDLAGAPLQLHPDKLETMSDELTRPGGRRGSTRRSSC
jgi:hypothetical protein